MITYEIIDNIGESYLIRITDNFYGKPMIYYEKHPKFFRKQMNKTFRKKFCRGSSYVNCHRCSVRRELYVTPNVPANCYMIANEVLERIIRKKKLEKLLS